MTIGTNDLKIFLSQRNRDTADGGGAMSPNVVVDGELNNVFDDVSSEDRVTGRVSARKIFPGVFSDDTERFFGAGLLIINPAQDENVDVLMTRATRYDDERADVVKRIESFLVPGGTLLWRLFNNHLQGTGSLTLYAPSGAPTPDLGDTLFLDDQDAEDGTQPSEAVKVQKVVSRQPQTFYDSQGAFQRDIMVLELTRPLQSDWEGEAVQRFTTFTSATVVRNSTVSAGARYYGVKRVQGDVLTGALQVNVGNPFSRIVPSTNAEEPVTDQSASLPGTSYKQAGPANSISVNPGSINIGAGATKQLYLGGTVLPGSVTLTGAISGTDNGDGTMSMDSSQFTAVVDYDTGTVSINNGGTGNNFGVSATATPAAAVQDSTLTVQIPVLEQTRALNYVRTLRPVPAPGTVSVDYRSLNNWFRLSDNGTGGLAGRQPGEGGGAVDYATGSVTATLAALPDVGTSIIISWGTPTTMDDGTTTIDAARPQFEVDIPEHPIVPGSLELDYESDGSTITITSNASGQLLDGTDVVGVYTPQTGKALFRPLSGRWPDSGAGINYSVSKDAQVLEQLQPTPFGAADQVSFTLGTVPVEPGSVEFEYAVSATVNGRVRTIELRIYDDGAGGLQYASGAPVPAGTVDYQTGAVDFPAAIGGG